MACPPRKDPWHGGVLRECHTELPPTARGQRGAMPPSDDREPADGRHRTTGEGCALKGMARRFTDQIATARFRASASLSTTTSEPPAPFSAATCSNLALARSVNTCVEGLRWDIASGTLRIT